MHFALKTTSTALSQGPRLITFVPLTLVQISFCLKDVHQTASAFSQTSRLIIDVPLPLSQTSCRLKVVYPPESKLQGH
jgi:hypothetical protein